MLDEQWVQYLFIGLIVLLLIWNIMRRRRSGNSNMAAATAVLENINENLRILEERLSNYQLKNKFQTGSWKAYKDRMGFLGTELTAKLNETFTLADDFNMRIEAAKKSNNMSTLQDMQVERLREPLTKSKEGIVAWLKMNYTLETQMNPRRGCSGM
jgi:hypothetical protein